MSELVQPIVVAKTGTHRNTLIAAAVASISSWDKNREFDGWDEWLSGRFTKTVRRASAKDFTKVTEWCEANGIVPAVFDCEEGSYALALPPMLYANFPKVLSRLQVSGTDFGRIDDGPDPESDVLVYVDESLTTGKASAQVAHAVWIASLGALSIGPAVASFSIRIVPFSELEAIANLNDSLVVIDSGLTEVEPNTLTAAVIGVRVKIIK